MNELLRHCGMKVKEFGMIIPTELSVVSSVGIVVERFDKKPADPVLIPIRTLKGAA